MMKTKTRSLPLWLSLAAAFLALLSALPVLAQTTPQTTPVKLPPDTVAPGNPTPPPATPPQAPPAKAAPADTAAPPPDRAVAYYHLALANTYEEEAAELGRPELVTRAIEEYKLALNADPGSPQLNNGLADLYFRTGHSHDAEVTARALLKNSPNDMDAHKLLGRIYLRLLGDGQNAVSSASPSGNVLDQAIAEFEKIVALQPKSVEDRMVLGQLYTVKHQPQKAEDEFKTAQAIEPESEEVVLNLARLYAESNDIENAAKVIEDVPVTGRTSRSEFEIGRAHV